MIVCYNKDGSFILEVSFYFKISYKMFSFSFLLFLFYDCENGGILFWFICGFYCFNCVFRLKVIVFI